MLGKVDSPYIVSLMGLIDTIVKWCNEYATEHIYLFMKKIIQMIFV